MEAFFGGAAVQPCKPEPNPFGPTPITPTKLAHVQPVPGLGGNRGRTLTAVLDTIVDLERQVIGATLQVEQKLPNGSSFGGLHGGYAKLSASAVGLHDFTFVPGVALSGTLPAEGRQAAEHHDPRQRRRPPPTARSRSAPAGAPPAPSPGSASA